MQIIGIENLRSVHLPCYAILEGGRIVINHDGCDDPDRMIAYVPALQPGELGDPDFKAFYGVEKTCMAGAMANGIASEELVIAMGRNGMLAAFGAGGLDLPRVETAIQRIQQALPNGPYAFNFIHNPVEEAIEWGTVELYLKHGVRVIEAAAFFNMTLSLVYFRVAGLSADAGGRVVINNKVIAKVSRREVAAAFMEPPPPEMVQRLLSEGRITAQQAQLAGQVPMADDISVEGDSGGHTDNRPLVSLLPSIIALRDEMQAKHGWPHLIRVGAGGGIGTPDAALAAYMMGAAYVLTGSVNQSCQESGASEHTRKLLAEADMTDVAMAPASDMFERGINLQVLKKGTMFPMRAKRLYELYVTYDSLEAIPAAELAKLEQQVFRDSVANIWAQTVEFFNKRDPAVLKSAEGNPKKKMALVFRWYLGMSSRWSNAGVAGRELDYQIWCGPSMGAFNDWARGTYLADYRNRRVADVANQILFGAAYQARVQMFVLQGIRIPAQAQRYAPAPLS